jgi:hypothetical protein
MAARFDQQKITRLVPALGSARADRELGHRWARHRLPESPYDRTPTRPTLGWMGHLPAPVIPNELGRQFARIANRLARLWDTPPACREYLDSLLLDRRGGRRGFPNAVLHELQTLSTYYRKLHPEAAPDVWDEVRERMRSDSARRGRF